MSSVRPHISIPKELALALEKHPGINKSGIAQDALRKHISNPNRCSCYLCKAKRSEAMKNAA